jgi:uroporphyrin-III C-methyltransferase
MNRANDPVFDSSRGSSLLGRRLGDPGERRAGRITTAISVLALAASGYSLLRLDGTRDRVDHVKDMAHAVESSQTAMRSDFTAFTKAQQVDREAMQAQLRDLQPMPGQVHDLTASIDELRGRSEGPQRAWSRAEALFLLELAQRRLGLDRDVGTAQAALQAADERLAMLREPALTPVREQIAKEQRALTDMHEPDRGTVLVQLAGAEDSVAGITIRGTMTSGPEGVAREPLPSGFFERAWAVIKGTFASLFSVERVHGGGGSLVSAEDEVLRRQHLQLLIFSARVAVIRHDSSAYRTALTGAQRWLDQYFEMSDAATAGVRKQLTALLTVDIDPPLPDISRSSKLLQRLTPGERGTS